ncbi:hypothetical protein PROFUN_13308 [Planoprotostelium fungivorum]|uniref:AMP-activated protein kinase glycogen-binding domain-containing protein n=1 Tax=Planoprotostelium fungivorum TaxID=1890364 RepID=A0A2P6N451_9EUKA|nr:hypothetical protein PROFUN_13308 [Planoprotostelium fungivorum]
MPARQDIVDHSAELNIRHAKPTQTALAGLYGFTGASCSGWYSASPCIDLIWPYGGRDVCIKGTWTNWQPIRMVYNGSVYTYPLFYSFGVKYIYCFIVDGKVCHDGLTAAEPNVYGGYDNFYYGPQLVGNHARDGALDQSSEQFYDISNNLRLVHITGPPLMDLTQIHQLPSTLLMSVLGKLAEYYLRFLGVIEQYDK